MTATLKKIQLRPENPYEEDCQRIRRVFAEHDYAVSLLQVYWMWERFSYDSCAGWLGLPVSDEQLFECCQPYFEDADE